MKPHWINLSRKTCPKREESVFFLCGLSDSGWTPQWWLKPEWPVLAFLQCPIPVAGCRGLKLGSWAFIFCKTRSLLNRWWESQKGRLGGQDLCPGFHILPHSSWILPDKVIACPGRKGPQGSRGGPRRPPCPRRVSIFSLMRADWNM